MTPVSKTDQAVNLWNSGDKHSAMRIFKTFKLGLTKQEHQRIVMAWEVMAGNGRIYSQMGGNPDEIKREGLRLVEEIFIKPKTLQEV